MQFIKIQEVIDMTSKKKTAIYKEMAEGTFPMKIKDGKSTYWLKSEIEDWMIKKVMERDSMMSK